MRRMRELGCALLALAASACGDLDNATTVHDLRVLAAKAEPAGFLVPLDDPGSLKDTQAKVTALVADPTGQMGTLSFTGEACPDYIDTITAASGKTTKLCPGPEVTDKLPAPLRPLLATIDLPPGMEPPLAADDIQYEPQVTFDGLTSDQLKAFFNDPVAHPSGDPTIDRSTSYNRDFSFDAIVNLHFALGDERADLIKRVVYWPLLPPALVPDPAALPEDEAKDCPDAQVANQNPIITSIDLFANRVEGEPTEPYADAAPTLSLATSKLYVQPTYDPASVERYYLRTTSGQAGAIQTHCRHENLTFQFFATAGTFSPPERTSELLPLLTSPDGKVHIDSQWNPPKPEKVEQFGKVRIWVVVRDERAGSSWSSRTFTLTP